MMRLSFIQRRQNGVKNQPISLAARSALIITAFFGLTPLWSRADEFETPRPFRRTPGEDAETRSGGFLDGLFQNQSRGIAVETLLMEGAQVGTLVGSGSGAGYGLTFSSTLGNRYFDVIGRARFHFASGEAHVTDQAVERELPFSLGGGDAIVGLAVKLLPGDIAGLQPYFGTAFKLSLTYLKLSRVPSSGTDLVASTTGMLTGTEMMVGVKYGSHAFFEFQLRQSAGKIGGLSDIGVGGAAVSAGYSW